MRQLTRDEEGIPLKLQSASVKDWEKSIRFGKCLGEWGSGTPLILNRYHR